MNKILYLIDKPNLYGSELHLLQLIEEFKSNYVIKVISFSEGPLLDKIDALNIPVDIVPFSWMPSIKRIKQLREIAHDFAPNIIHGHQPKATFWAGIISRTIGAKCINTIHSSAGNTALEKKGYLLKIITVCFHYGIQFFSELFANKVVFVSETSKKMAFFKKKAVVIYNWINKANQTDYIERKPNSKVKLLFVGSISKLKGIDILIDMLILLKSKGIDFEIDILGNGKINFVAKVKNKLKDENINAIFHGYVRDTKPYYEKADVFMLFSRTETFGIAYAEAANYGLPIFARKLPVLQEILPHLNYLSDDLNYLSDSLIALIGNKDLYVEISKGNNRWANEKFDFNKNIKVLEFLYSSLLDKNNS